MSKSQVITIRSNRSSLGDTPIFDAHLERIIEEEDNYQIIYSIREELLNRVFEECFQTDNTMAIIKFVVSTYIYSCVQILNLYCMHYNKDILLFELYPGWERDVNVEASPQDTWANHSVPVIKPELPVTVSSKVLAPNLTPVEEAKKERLQFSGKSEESLKEEKVMPLAKENYVDKTPSVAHSEAGIVDEAVSEVSFFTGLVQANLETINKVTGTRCVNEKEVEVGRPEPVFTSKSRKLKTDSFLLKLPPIRLKGKFKSEKYNLKVESEIAFSKKRGK